MCVCIEADSITMAAVSHTEAAQINTTIINTNIVFFTHTHTQPYKHKGSAFYEKFSYIC